MMYAWIALGVFGVIYVLLYNSWYDDWGSLAGFGFIVVLCGIGVTSCVNSNWYSEHQAAETVRKIENEKPRLIREVDGCKVYAFNAADRWHYFTKCPNARTTTDGSYSVRSGKTSHEEFESITTP